MDRFRLSWGARGKLAAGLLLPFAASACIPYTAGTTAQPLRPGQTSTSLSTFVMPSVGRLDPNRSYSFLAADLEVRRGIDDRSDVGIRIPSGVGLVVNYKRLLSDSSSRMRVAVIPGAGFVNMGNHAEFEFTLIAS